MYLDYLAQIDYGSLIGRKLIIGCLLFGIFASVVYNLGRKQKEYVWAFILSAFLIFVGLTIFDYNKNKTFIKKSPARVIRSVDLIDGREGFICSKA